MKNRALVGLCAVLLIFTALPAAASTFLAMDQEELLAGSNAVVQGTVLETRAFWNEERTIILTEARIEVQDLVAGDAPAVVTVRTPGGEVGNYRVEATGFPTFSAGEQVLVYLNSDGNDFRVTGHLQGQYRIRASAKGTMAVPSLEEGVRLLTKDGRLAPAPQPVQLETLKNQIRDRRGLVELRGQAR